MNKRQIISLKAKPASSKAKRGQHAPQKAVRHYTAEKPKPKPQLTLPTPEAKRARERVSEAMPTHLKSDSLAFALVGAGEAMAQVQTGMALPQALATFNETLNLTPQAWGAIQDISYRTMRRWGETQTLIALMTTKQPDPPRLYGLLSCALMLLIESHNEDTEKKTYEAFTIVDQAVSAVSNDRVMAHGKGMVNAVLRRFLREYAALMAQAQNQVEARWNYPAWWVDQVKGVYPSNWRNILKAGNKAPPLILRVNQKKQSVDAYLAVLHEQEIMAEQVGESAVWIKNPLPVERIPGFMEGMVSVQDAAAQHAARLLDVKDGMRVLDACAAPGGKTGHILEIADVTVQALDVDAQRLKRVKENMDRLCVDATLTVGDAAKSDWWNGELYDRILADVPCTASGIVRRHPDIPWLRRKNDARQLAVLSADILDNLWQKLRPGGKLLLVTCSIWPQESEGQAAAFAYRHQAIRLDALGQLFPCEIAGENHDGLFYALFQKQA